MTKEAKVPVGRVRRLLKMAGAGARTTAGLLSSTAADVAAARAAEALGTLRGLAAKVGQMASYVDGILPEAHREEFEKAMSSLQASAPTSSAKEIREMVEHQLGATITELFAEWGDEPIASASVGQVHAARLHDGREVAVKVQHPGIDEAIRGDLDNAAVVKNMVTLLMPRGFDPGTVFAEVKRRLLEELDYVLEAEHQRFFAKLHEMDSSIIVPNVVANRSSTRVLTTELHRGTSLEEATRAPVEMRRAHAETMWRFVFKSLLLSGRFNADPHPGNYLFRPDGSVVFLDFGLVQPLPESMLRAARGMHRAALLHDESRFANAARTLLGTRGGRYETMSLQYSRRCFEPLFDSPFRITRPYVADLVGTIGDMKKQMFGFAADVRKSFSGFPPELVFLNRLQFGFYSVLARLDVEVDYAAIEREFLHEAGIDSLGPDEIR